MTQRIKTGLAIGGLAAVATLAAVSAQAQRNMGGYSYQSGQELYEHVCQGCHMPDAKGAVGAGMYPALAGNRKLAAQTYPVIVILRGLRAMPAFSNLTDAQVVAVTNYIRTSFGNSYANPVTPEQVKALRPNAGQQSGQRPG